LRSARIVPLTLRVRPKIGETAPSLAARLAARHRDTDLDAFCRELGLNLTALSLGRGVERLTALAGIDEVSRPVIDARNRTVLIGHALVSLGDWSRSGGRHCPSCLREDTLVARAAGRRPEVDIHRRASWDVASVTHCPTHGHALTATCGHCGASPAWGDLPGRCKACGGGLATVRSSPRSSQARFSDYAAARIEGRPTDVPLLDGLELKDVVLHMERLGLVITTPPGARKPRKVAGAASVLREAAFGSLDDWPAALDRAFDHALAQARESSAPAGLIGTYGWFYEDWAARLDTVTAFGSAVRTAMRAHAVRHGVVAPGETVLLAGPTIRPGGLTRVARRLGWGYERTRREAARRGAIPPGSRRGVGVSISEACVAEIERDHVAMVTVREASCILGIGKSQCAGIIASGLLGEPGLGPPLRVSRAACAGFAARLATGARRLDRIPQGSTPLPRACQAAGVTLTRACLRIVAGEVGIGGVVGEGTSLAHLVVEPGTLGVRRSDGTFSIAQAAAELGLHHEAARFLARRGLLATADGKPGRIASPGLERFRASYMTGGEAAALLSTSPKACLRRLRERSVIPVAAPPECRQVVYRRRDVETAFRRVLGPAASDGSGMDGQPIERSRRRQGRRGIPAEAPPGQVQARAGLLPIRAPRRAGRCGDVPRVRSRGRP
jgi:hypothetical protein